MIYKMDTDNIVKGLINEYIKPPHPIYKVEYVMCDIDFEGDEVRTTYKKHVGLFNMMPKDFGDKVLTGEDGGRTLRMYDEPISQERKAVNRCEFLILGQGYDDNDERLDIKKSWVNERNKLLPFIKQEVIDSFEENDDVYRGQSDHNELYIFKSIERVA